MVKLTLDLIIQKCKTDNLQKITKLDVWSSELEEVSLVKDLPALEICSLSLNKITSLKFFQYSINLTELYLRKNLITDLFEIKNLRNCTKLKVLWLWDNPIAQHPLYRQYIIKNLPNLMKLDNTPISIEERQECQRLNISDQEIIKGSHEIINSQQNQDSNSQVNQKQVSAPQILQFEFEQGDRPRSLNNRRVHSSNSQNKNPRSMFSHQQYSQVSGHQSSQASNQAAGQNQGSSQQSNRNNNSGIGIAGGSGQGGNSGLGVAVSGGINGQNQIGAISSERSGLVQLNQQINNHQGYNSQSGTNSSANGISLQNQLNQNLQQQQQIQIQNGTNNYRNENILCAVLALLKELDESGLELVKRDIDRKLQSKKQQK